MLGFLSALAAIMAVVMFRRAVRHEAAAYLWLGYALLAGVVLGVWVVLP